MITLRAVTLDDADEVADVLNAFAIRFVGEPDADAEALRGWWTAPPPWDLERDVVVVVDGDRVVGYGDIGDQGADGKILWLDIRGEYPELLHDELERRARERAAPGAVVRAVAYEPEDEYKRLLDERGYRPLRSSYRMYADLRTPPPPPVWPDGVTVRLATAGEEETLHAVQQETFADHDWFVAEPLADFVHQLTTGSTDPTLWFVAEDGGQPAGIAVCRPHAEGDEAMGWVSILAVRRPWRRRGLGTALLLHTLHAFRERGRTRVGLGVDADNSTGAVRLYERAGMEIGWSFEIWETNA